MFFSNSGNNIHFEQEDYLSLSDINKVTSINIILPKMRCNKRNKSAVSDHMQSIKHLTADHKVEFFIEKGQHIMKRNMISGKEIRRKIGKLAGYTIATAVAAVLVIGTVTTLDVRLGREVIVNGNPVGLVSSVSNVEEVLVDIESLTASSAASSNNVDDLDVKYVTRIVSEKDITPDFQLKQNILAECDSMVEAYALYVDGEVVAAALDEQSIFDVLDALKAEYNQPDKEMVMGFDKDVSVRKEYVSTTLLHNPDTLKSIIKGDGAAVETYIAKEGESLWDIADKYNMTHEEISKLNDGIDPVLSADQKVKYVRTTPFVRVKSEYFISDVEQIPYTVETVETNELATGRKIYTQSGKNGTKSTVVNVISYNGVEAERDVVADGEVVDPENAYILIGTNKNMVTTYADAGVCKGWFMKPHEGEYTSLFGIRSMGFHTGVDIAANIGDEVLAADGGIVTFVGWKGGYGNLVIIDHGKGIQTYYGHNSEIIVNEGERVAQGEVVAKSGNTGNSTGPHVHFEVRVNGQSVDPLPYLK